MNGKKRKDRKGKQVKQSTAAVQGDHLTRHLIRGQLTPLPVLPL
jgi:hypothetical protein